MRNSEFLQTLATTVGGGGRTWLVTGAAGFIGSHLARTLVQLGENVVGVDNLSTGHRHNIRELLAGSDKRGAGEFRFVEGDVRDTALCQRCTEGVDFVLHQAALGSVPRSVDDPAATHDSNVNGFLNLLLAARNSRVQRFVYASSSAVYGDHEELPKVEERIGAPLSPYAVSKYVNELYAANFARLYDMTCVGLRYFNVFGPNQDPNGPYAAVIPRWTLGLLQGAPCEIFGDGETTRDFCYVDNVVAANLLAATSTRLGSSAPVYNIACGERTSLTGLFELIRSEVSQFRADAARIEPTYKPFRTGDVRHSLASIDRARRELGFEPNVPIAQGIGHTVRWFAGTTDERRGKS